MLDTVETKMNYPSVSVAFGFHVDQLPDNTLAPLCDIMTISLYNLTDERIDISLKLQFSESAQALIALEHKEITRLYEEVRTTKLLNSGNSIPVRFKYINIQEFIPVIRRAIISKLSSMMWLNSEKMVHDTAATSQETLNYAMRMGMDNSSHQYPNALYIHTEANFIFTPAEISHIIDAASMSGNLTTAFLSSWISAFIRFFYGVEVELSDVCSNTDQLAEFVSLRTNNDNDRSVRVPDRSHWVRILDSNYATPAYDNPPSELSELPVNTLAPIFDIVDNQVTPVMFVANGPFHYSDKLPLALVFRPVKKKEKKGYFTPEQLSASRPIQMHFSG